MSADNSWTGMIRNRFRRQHQTSPYARPKNGVKKVELGWSLSGLLNFMSGAAQDLPTLATTTQDVTHEPIHVEDETKDEANKPVGEPSSSTQPAAVQMNVVEEQPTLRTPPRAEQPFEPTTPNPIFDSITPNNTPLEKIHSFLERKKQDGTPLNEIEYAGISAMLEKAREQTFEPEAFRFSSSPLKSNPSTPARSPQPNFGAHGPTQTPTRKGIFSASTTLPTFTNNVASPSGSSPRKLVHNPNGEYRWMGAGSSRVSSSPRRRRTPARNAPQNDTTKRRRTGDDKEDSEPTFSTSKTAPAALGGNSKAGPSTPPRVQPLPRASIRLKTAPVVPSPLRNVVNSASPPGSPPSTNMSNGSPPTRTHAATVLTEIIGRVTPPPKPDIANPYQTASPVKPTAVPKTRKRMADRRAKEKQAQAELEREKEKEKEKKEAMPSPKAIIEATVPKGAKRSRPPPNLGKSQSRVGVSESHLFGARNSYSGRFGVDQDEPMIEELDEEASPLPKKKTRSVEIEEIEDEEMSNGTMYTKPSEIIEPSEAPLPKPSIIVPSNAGPSALNGSFGSPTSPTGPFGGGSKSSVFGSKSSLPKEPSKLRSSFIAEEEEEETTKSMPPPAFPASAFTGAFGKPGQSHTPEAPRDPQSIAKSVEQSKLPVFVFNFSAPPVILDYPEARKLAAASQPLGIPKYDFWKPAQGVASSSTPKTNGNTSTFPSSSSSAPQPFNWSAAGMKPAAPSGGGEWTCDTCMLKNSASATEKCVVCDAPRSGAGTAAKEEVKPAPKTTPPAVPEIKAFNWAAAGLKPLPKDDGASWTCGSCMLSNPATATEKCTICDAPR